MISLFAGNEPLAIISPNSTDPKKGHEERRRKRDILSKLLAKK
jgi:hypothetical protein